MKSLKFPSAYTILFSILILCTLITFFIPSGQYNRIRYQSDTDSFVVTSHQNVSKTIPATDDALKALSIPNTKKDLIQQSKNGDIPIPGTYHEIKKITPKITDIPLAIVHGFYHIKDIGFFILILGGVFGLLNQSNSINNSFVALSRKTQNSNHLLVISVFVIIAICGTTFGMVEELTTLIPLLLPVFYARKHDSITTVATLYIASTVGFMFSTVNVFGVGIGSVSANTNYLNPNSLFYHLLGLIVCSFISIVYILYYDKKVRNNPNHSLVYDIAPIVDAQTEKLSVSENYPKLTNPQKYSMCVFLSTFFVMIWGIVTKNWWLDELSSLFLATTLILILINTFWCKYKEEDTFDSLVKGMSEMVGVVLLLSITAGIYYIFQETMIIDTIMFEATNLLQHTSPFLFIVGLFVLYLVLGIFIDSASSLAMLSLPLLAPLADSASINRDVVVSAYLYGHRLISLISPTCFIIVCLNIVGIPFSRWFKFALPLFWLLFITSLILLLAQHYLVVFH